MKTDELGIPRFSNRDLIDMIYSGNVEKCHVVLCDPSDDVDKFNAAMEEQGLDKLQKYIPSDDIMREEMAPVQPTNVAGVDTHDRALLAKRFFELQQGS